MQIYKDDQGPAIYEGEDYLIWVDIDEQVVNIFLAEKGLTLHFAYEDFESFRQAINSVETLPKWWMC